jgi:UDP-N-acetylmuramate dehydrogenase
MLWPQNLNKKIKIKVNLARYTSFKIGGPAKFFFEPQSLRELQQALIFAKHAGIRVFILGAGSNILVSDTGLDGLVIKLSGRDFKQLYIKGACIVAGGGLKLSQLNLFAKNQGLSGLEFLIGIPGTLGGALVGNAGAWGQSIGGLVREVSVLDYKGRLKLLKAKSLKFAYRKSNLNEYIVLGAKLQLCTKAKDVIVARLKGYLAQRSKTQDKGVPSAGCIFKNPSQGAAGRIIELCGLKGRVKGGAAISELHANFILNTGRANSRDVLSLMNLMRKEAKKRFQVNLEPEIKIWQ